MRGIIAASMMLVVGIGGCQPAERYGPRSASDALPKKIVEDDAPNQAVLKPLAPEIQWIDIDNPPKPDVLIEFVHAEKAPEAWSKLPSFWNAPPQIIQIKVPLGLPDPREYLPADEPLTLAKWKLGQLLFFDDSWLEAKTGTSCATCHQPDHGFADRERTHPDGFNAPTLLNCVFNRWQFWDGRAVLLEEVVQRTLEDERESNPPKPFRHTWSGVIARLRNKAVYHEQFNNVFGKPASEEDGAEKANITQDTVGRALACYLRTLLAGDSIHDRALHEQASQHSPTLAAVHYQAVLEDADLAELGRDKAKKGETADELMRGYLLFHGLDKNRPLVNCSHCHNGPTFRDNQFHNLGIGHSSRPGQEGGRFAQVPIGRKNRYLIDAYKTPTLRALRRSGPYFHNGSAGSLREVVEFYNNGAERNSHLDPELRGKDGQTRLLGLNAAEIEALVLFLNAFNGRDVDSVVKTPQA
ncbi:MAG: cytochrome-c peroxidase, partial [Gemmataceae bacterium]